ncbi:hypothetical protein BC827DRAFT_162868 [Russula dissimulans]|nr:hypothetical protein BC827DRAFT_162868 [Russula dissimulans]
MSRAAKVAVGEGCGAPFLRRVFGHRPLMLLKIKRWVELGFGGHLGVRSYDPFANSIFETIFSDPPFYFIFLHFLLTLIGLIKLDSVLLPLLRLRYEYRSWIRIHGPFRPPSCCSQSLIFVRVKLLPHLSLDCHHVLLIPCTRVIFTYRACVRVFKDFEWPLYEQPREVQLNEPSENTSLLTRLRNPSLPFVSL